MKKIFLYATLICGLCSCGLDNYDAPTASLSGAIIDKETKENVPGQAQNGTKIRMYEFYNDEWSVQPNDSWVSQDGTFSNTAVFTGKYKILAEGPFETVEPIEMEFGYSLIPLVDESNGGKMINRIAHIGRSDIQRNRQSYG